MGHAPPPRVSSSRAARSGGSSGGGGGGGGDGLDSLEQHYSSGRHRSPDRTRSTLRGVDREPVPEEAAVALRPSQSPHHRSAAVRHGSPGRSQRRKHSPGRTARGGGGGGDGVEGMQMVLLKQEESLALAARHGAEQEHFVDGLTEEIIALNRTSSELQLRTEHMLTHQSALEDEVVHLHSELTATADEKERLAAEVAALGSKLERSRSHTEDLAGMLEKVLFGADGKELAGAASTIQARYRGKKTRKDTPALPAREARGGALPPPSFSGGAAGGGGGGAADWDVNGVLVWLEGLGMGRYTHLFESESIDGATLLHLGKEDLEELGVRNGIHRARIAAGAQKLSGGGGM